MKTFGTQHAGCCRHVRRETGIYGKCKGNYETLTGVSTDLKRRMKTPFEGRKMFSSTIIDQTKTKKKRRKEKKEKRKRKYNMSSFFGT